MADMDYIVVDCLLNSAKLAERAKGKLQAELDIDAMLSKSWRQIERDALIGTFGDITPAIFDPGLAALPDYFKARQEASAVVEPGYEEADLDKGKLPFKLKLHASYFAHPRVGLQHLVQVLCGDLFGRGTLEIESDVTVRSVDLTPLKKSFAEHFKDKPLTIDDIRAAFGLNGAKPIYGKADAKLDLPLLAFSVKPRNGLDTATFERNALGVLRAGFNLVEVDVRNIDFLEKPWRDAYARIAKAALEIDTHMARFSLNLSAPADLALQYAEEFAALHAGKGPWAVKVDGGLDGLSTILALRERFKGRQPIITCYPILGPALGPQIGADTFREMLILAGVDIIYPGGAPRFGVGNFVDAGKLERGYNRYWSIINDGRPMPTIAAGVHAGQLPTYYRMFGPNVAYFLGGGVALHRNGAFWQPRGGIFRGARKPELGKRITMDQAVGGAELCRFAVEQAASTGDSEILFDLLGVTRDHYVDPQNPGEGDPRRFDFEKPKDFLKGPIKDFVERKKAGAK